MDEVDLLKEEKNKDKEQVREMEEWSDQGSDEDQQQMKIEENFKPHDLIDEMEVNDMDEATNDGIFDAKDLEEIDTQMQEADGDRALSEFYDPVEFNSINVPANIRELFHYITKYRPQILEMETKLKPFLPDFIPAVGDPDAFLKIDRPDGAREMLGLTVIDEPSLNQTDPSVLDLRLRSIYKRSSTKTMVARTVEDGNKSKAIDKWIKDINELHRSKPLPTVSYYKPLPDIDTLLQEWNAEVEEVLAEDTLLPYDLDCELTEYIDVACGLLDIPIYSGHRIHSLHLLLTLYSEMGRLQK